MRAISISEFKATCHAGLERARKKSAQWGAHDTGRLGGSRARRWIVPGVTGSALLFASLASATAVSVQLVSKGDPSTISDSAGGTSTPASISADGRYVVFGSDAANLVPGQVNNALQNVFLYDRVAGTTTLVSHVPGIAATAGNNSSQPVAISSDGSWVVFQSVATNLTSGGSDTNGNLDAFLYERATGIVTLVSHMPGIAGTAGNNSSQPVAISADGSWVLFQSVATDLVSGGSDINGSLDAFLYERATGNVTLVSHVAGIAGTTGNDQSTATAISSNGSWVAFYTNATDLIAGGSDTNGAVDAFLYERATGIVTLVSHVPGIAGTAGNGDSFPTAISSDGLWVALGSAATNLIAGGSDTNGNLDAFLYERATGIVTLVSHMPGLTGTAGNSSSRPVAISSDGSWVAFFSKSNNLISGGSDTNAQQDAFLYERATGMVTLVSHVPGVAGTAGNNSSQPAAIASDGSWVAFLSTSNNLISLGSDTNTQQDAFLYERATGIVTLVSHVPGIAGTAANGGSFLAAISSDGSWVAFQSNSTNLVGSDRNGNPDVFLDERATGTNTLISRRDPALPNLAAAGSSSVVENALSADGRYMVFGSRAANLVSGQADTNNAADVFLYDRVAGTTILVSHVPGIAGTAGNGESFPAAISSDGSWVAFRSDAANLIAGGSDTNGTTDAFLYERATGTVTLVSHVPGIAGSAGNGGSFPAAISSDGSWVAFGSTAANLISLGSDTNGADDAFLYERATGTVTLVSHVPGFAGVTGNGRSDPAAMSSDGSRVAFSSSANNLISGGSDTNGENDAFLYERATGAVTLMGHVPGMAGTAGNGFSYPTAMSSDGSWVALQSDATNLIAGGSDTNGTWDAFLYERATGAVTLIGHVPGIAGTAGNGESLPLAMSSDGSWVAFYARATDLISGGSDTNGTYDAFLYERATGAVTLMGHVPGMAGTTGNGFSYPTAMSSDGSWVAFYGPATNLISGGSDTNGTPDAFLYERATGTVTLVSHVPGMAGTTGNGFSYPTAMSSDGSWVAVQSDASDLVSNDFNQASDAFLAAVQTGVLVTVTPCRLFDSRLPIDGPALPANANTVLVLGSRCGVPVTAKALSVNLTAVQPTTDGLLQAFAGDQPTPQTSALSFRAGKTRANNGIVQVSTDGTRKLTLRPVMTGPSVDVVIDVNGYFE